MTSKARSTSRKQAARPLSHKVHHTYLHGVRLSREVQVGVTCGSYRREVGTYLHGVRLLCHASRSLVMVQHHHLALRRDDLHRRHGAQE